MNIVIVNRWPRYHDGVRWDNELTRYEEFIDHDRHRVSYVVDGPGAAGVLADPARIAHIVEVADVNVPAQLRGAVAEIIEQVGPVDQLTALSEFTLEIAARVREELGIPGPTRADVAPYRNKIRMKELLLAAGVRVPTFAPCTDVEQCVAFAAACGYPVIVKPVDGAASIGVHRVDEEGALRALLPTVDMARHEIEEFVVGDIHHVDGYVNAGGEVRFQVVSRYLNDCLGFAAGGPLGSVVLQGSPLRERIEQFALDVLAALDMEVMPYHLELFVTPAGELVFLEIGGRVPGGDVPYLINELFGVNLYELWLRELNGTPLPVPERTGDPTGGWLTIPKPAGLPARVVRSTPMRSTLPSIWRELVPGPGDVLVPGGSYDSLHSGRFILLAERQEQVEKDIGRIIDEFELEVTPL